MNITILQAAIKTHADALKAKTEIITEIGRVRLTGASVSAELVATADAAFLAEIEAARTRNAAIAAAKEAGIPEAQNMHIPTERSADVLAMEYKPIKRAGGTLTF